MVGFKMNESMVGTHRLAGQEADQPLHFHLTWGKKSVQAFCSPKSESFLKAEATGVITAGGLAHRAECRGSLTLLYFKERKIRYELEFTGEDGRAYRYTGEKRDIRPWNLHKTHTTCYGQIIDCLSGEIVSNSVVRFPLRELPAFLLSARLVFHDEWGREKESRFVPGGQADKARPPYKVLRGKDAELLASFAGGLIPRGGPHFAEGAYDLADKWLPRADHTLSRMPAPTRVGFMASLRLLDRILPAVFLHRLTRATNLDEVERTKLLSMAENGAFPGPLSVLLAKAIVFPAFYGLKEAGDAIGHCERFDNPQFIDTKD